MASFEDLDRQNDEMDSLDDDSDEYVPLPTRKTTNKKWNKKSIPPNKKKTTRSSSAESNQDVDEVQAAPLSRTNAQIHVGEEYQADVPEYVSLDYAEDEKDRDEMIWGIPDNIDEGKLDQFVNQSNQRYNASIDQALFILTRHQFNFKRAMDAVKKRVELRDVWLDEEIDLFNDCYLHYGKNFRRIRTAMPHRSTGSIVQHYYDSKKKVNYKLFFDSKIDESCVEEPEEKFPYLGKEFDHMCENCGEKCENMEKVEPSNSKLRYECASCKSYFTKVDSPQPTDLRSVSKERFQIPDYMKEFMTDFAVLSSEANSETYRNRFIGDGQSLRDIVGTSYKAEASIINEKEDVGMNGGLFCWRPRTEKGAEMFREEFDDEPLDSATCALPDVPNNLITGIWKQKQTLCMEEIEVIAEDARRKKYEAVVSFSKVNRTEVDNWRNEMNAMKLRMERMTLDMDLAPSYRKKNAPKETTGTVEHTPI